LKNYHHRQFSLAKFSGIISKYNSRKVLPGKDGALLTSDGEKMIEAILSELL